MSESWRVCVCVCVHVCMCAHMAQSLKLKAQLAFGSGVGGPWVKSVATVKPQDLPGTYTEKLSRTWLVAP